MGSTLLAFILVFGVFAVGIRSGQVSASSHREAPDDQHRTRRPTIPTSTPSSAPTSRIPSPSSPTPGPFEEPGGGPNYFTFGDDVLYELHIDNVGDAQSAHHLPVPLQHHRSPTATPSSTTPARSSAWTIPNWNVKQTYTVTRIDNGKATVLGENLMTPPRQRRRATRRPTTRRCPTPRIQTLSDGSKVFAGQSRRSLLRRPQRLRPADHPQAARQRRRRRGRAEGLQRADHRAPGADEQPDRGRHQARRCEGRQRGHRVWSTTEPPGHDRLARRQARRSTPATGCR